jgi:Ca2+-binding RTX toxin-like protein
MSGFAEYVRGSGPEDLLVLDPSERKSRDAGRTKSTNNWTCPVFLPLLSLGARSFSIWDSAGNQVFDSGSDFERITYALIPAMFNANDGLSGKVDQRSDDKGPEPEGVATGVVNGRTYAFVGLERTAGGVMVYDVTVPSQPRFVQYAFNNNQDNVVDPTDDIAPEGVLFISAAESPTGNPLVVLSNEVSGTVRIYSIGGTLLVNGNTGDNVIVVNQSGEDDQAVIDVVRDGVPAGSFPAREVQKVVVHGLDGNDRLVVNNTVNVTVWLFGDGGNDTLLGGKKSGMLLGGDGDDVLIGGNARDVLIGGLGADTLRGQQGEDVLIGGTTVYDGNDYILGEIFSRWNAGGPYQRRIDALARILNPSTVGDDLAADVLFGEQGDDWFMVGAGDTHDATKKERLN